MKSRPTGALILISIELLSTYGLVEEYRYDRGVRADRASRPVVVVEECVVAVWKSTGDSVRWSGGLIRQDARSYQWRAL